MSIRDWIKDFNPIKVINNINIEQIGGTKNVYYNEGGRYLHLHVNPDAVTQLKQTTITTELEGRINEASAASLASMESSLNLLSNSTRQDVIVATVLNSSLDTIKNK